MSAFIILFAFLVIVPFLLLLARFIANILFRPEESTAKDFGRRAIFGAVMIFLFVIFKENIFKLVLLVFSDITIKTMEKTYSIFLTTIIITTILSAGIGMFKRDL